MNWSKRTLKKSVCSFILSLADVIDGAELIFIAVGTPPGEDGSADLQYVLGVASDIGKHLRNYAVIVDKSTVPVGTADKVTAAIQSELDKRNSDVTFDVASNPEFLKEGAAIEDFMRPDRVVIGTATEQAAEMMHDLYKPFVRNHQHIIIMGIRDAEMTKYTANSMLATKISFMNEMSEICEELDFDIGDVRLGVGSDSRIGYEFIYPGCGYGGSCFPKDVKALVSMAGDCGVPSDVLHAVELRNQRQKESVAVKMKAFFKDDVNGKTFCLWGLAFKPGTDDMREASSLQIMKDLIGAGAKIQAYDPVAFETARAEMPKEWFDNGDVAFFDSMYDALDNTDALILATEWKQFQNPDFSIIKQKLNSPVIFDGRNQYDPAQMTELNFVYFGIGRTNQEQK